MSGGRLALDDALKQAQDNPHGGFEGWSQARIRAYKMIDENPEQLLLSVQRARRRTAQGSVVG